MKFVPHSLRNTQMASGIQLVKASVKGGRDQLRTFFA